MSRVLVINCGSSSIKFALINVAEDELLVDGIAERLGNADAQVVINKRAGRETTAVPAADHAAAMQTIISQLSSDGWLKDGLLAIGHRVVHGGEAFQASTIINAAVIEAIEACSHLAPLHNPANLLGIRTAQTLFPDLPQVAVFDTAFHQTLPRHAYLYPVPYAWYTSFGVRRYGFHGTSHRYVTHKAAELLERPYAELRLISAHLGNGCSAAAVVAGACVDTTMGLTPLEGLVMGTRSGDVDPSLHAFLHAQTGMSLTEITNALNKQSGLLGLSGVSNDMRTLQAAADEGDDQAAIAIEVFCYRLAKSIAALSVPLGRIDALIFTGGIGEHAAPIRAKVLNLLQILGFELDSVLNEEHGKPANGRITQASGPLAMVIPTNEESMIAQDCATLIEA